MLYVSYTSFKKTIHLYVNSNKGKLIQAVCMKTVMHFLETESSRNQVDTADICTEYYSSKISVDWKNTGYMYNVHSDLTSTSLLLLPNWRTDALQSWFWKGYTLLVKLNIVLFFPLSICVSYFLILSSLLLSILASSSLRGDIWKLSRPMELGEFNHKI